MGKAEQIGDREFRNSMTSFPRDLLRRFVSSSSFAHKFQRQSEEDGEDLELSLGLSMNGRFGFDPQDKLSRSSSIPDFLNLNATRTENEDSCSTLPLVRACSLPTETEEEWRKRKELQTLRRMEAKRKRSEKQRNLKTVRDRSRGLGEENDEEDKKQPSVKGTCQVAVGSQGSFGSHGSGSSGISEAETQPFQGTNKCSEARSPSSAHSTSENEQKQLILGGGIAAETPEKSAGFAPENKCPKPVLPNKGVGGAVRNILEDMPCVSTTGDGPNGKRIEGFLYRYRKGEEVRIVCVCHGSFLSPAEFVKHAGGSDVAHPLKHIVVNPSSFL